MSMNRRTFIQSSITAGVTLGFPAILTAQANRVYRTALIGCGWWGNNILREAMASGACCGVGTHRSYPPACILLREQGVVSGLDKFAALAGQEAVLQHPLARLRQDRVARARRHQRRAELGAGAARGGDDLAVGLNDEAIGVLASRRERRHDAAAGAAPP